MKNTQVEMLEREIAHMRRKLTDKEEEKTKQATEWEDIVKKVHLDIEHEKEKQKGLQDKADNAAAELHTARTDLSTCEAKLAAAEKKLENLATSRNDNTEESTTTLEARVETEAIKVC